MLDYFKDLSILVSSCDLYEDAWMPFFKLLSIQWPECSKLDIVLNTEHKRYLCDFLNVRSFCGGSDITWSKRLINCLNTIKTEYVLVFLEDEFLIKQVNNYELNRVISYMNKYPDIGIIYPHKTNKQTQKIEDDYFSRDLITDTHRLVCICAIWRKSYLLKVLRDTESPWEFEQNAPSRSKGFPDKVLQYNNRLPDLITYDDQLQIGYGITDKKWLPKTKELFDKYGITVNYDNLGFYPYENQIIAAKDKQMQKQLNQSLSLNPIESLHIIKKKIKARKHRNKNK